MTKAFIEDLEELVEQTNSGRKIHVLHVEVAHPEEEHLKELTERFICEKILPEDFTSFITYKNIQSILPALSNMNSVPSIVTTKTNSEPLEYITLFANKHRNNILNYITRSAGFDKLSSILNTPNTNFASLPKYCANAVAQTAITLTLDCMKNTNLHISNAIQGTTEDVMAFREIKYSSLAVFGAGNIGYEIICMAKGLGFDEVLAVDLREKHLSNEYNHSIQFVSPLEAISKADIIINAMNLTTDISNPFYNVKYFDDLLCTSNKKPIFVNIARGEVVSTDLLLSLFWQGKIYGIGLDVYPNEAKFKEEVKRFNTIQEDEQEIAHPDIIFSNKENLASYDLMNISNNRDGNIYTHLHKAYNGINSNRNKAHETMILVAEAFNEGKFKKCIRNYDTSDIKPF